MALHADAIYFIGSPTDIFVRYNCGGKLKFSIILNKRTYFLNYVWFTCKYFVLKFGKKNIYICLVSRIVLRISQWFLEVIYVYLSNVKKFITKSVLYNNVDTILELKYGRYYHISNFK